MRHLGLLLLALVIAAPAGAQVQSRPTDPPIVTAENESWYRLGEPLQFAGDVYYPAGATVFFNGNTMVRTGHYNGIPLYADTTLEPYSVVFVPVGRGLMQPYERRRQGDLAGTTGSRTPSFPVQTVPGSSQQLVAPSAPTTLPQPIGAVSVYTPGAPGAAGTTGSVAPAPTGTTYTPLAQPEKPGPMETAIRPQNNDGVWVRFSGEKWVSAGTAVPLVAGEFDQIGDYAGFPVYAKRGAQDTIYLPSRAGLVAPYRKK